MNKYILIYKVEALALAFKCIEKTHRFFPTGLSDNDLDDFTSILEEVMKKNGFKNIEIGSVDIGGNWKDYFGENISLDNSIRYIPLSSREIEKIKKRKKRIMTEKPENESPETLIKNAIERIAEDIYSVVIEEKGPIDEIESQKMKREQVEIVRKMLNQTAIIFNNYIRDVYITGRTENTWQRKKRPNT